MSESRLNVAVHTPVDELTDEQKQLITDSWAALSPEEQETYAAFKPVQEEAPEAEASQGEEETV